MLVAQHWFNVLCDTAHSGVTVVVLLFTEFSKQLCLLLINSLILLLKHRRQMVCHVDAFLGDNALMYKHVDFGCSMVEQRMWKMENTVGMARAERVDFPPSPR